ncbi:MAG: S-layer homology domain-containing protein [Clostridia bacterium]|nr:S-layer homology domain-containing protein [Clostridia bacterium]
MKKLFSLILAAAMGVGTVQTAFAETSFTDISDPKYAWAKTQIEEMAEQGYIAGYEDNTYRPDNQVTRLETIVLFSRAIGANRSENEEVLEAAKAQYGDFVDSIGLNFGQDEVSFMMYRGILDEDDVDTFLRDGKAAVAMPRQEAAAIITKAMCADDVANAEVLIDMEYTDAQLISSDYAQYVYYVSEQGIMNGMDDGYFSPETSVLRSQIAVMLHRVVDKMNLYIETALVTELDTEKNNITIMDPDGAEIPMGYVEYTKFYVDNELADENAEIVHTNSRLTYINNELVFVDVLETVVDETVRGIFQGYSMASDETTVTLRDAATKEATEYVVAINTSYNELTGSGLTLKSFKAGDYVEIDITNDKIISMTRLQIESSIKDAVVQEVGIDDDMYIVISHEDEEYDGLKIFLDEDVSVYKNGDFEDLSVIYRGDSITIIMEYEQVTKVKAVSDTRTYEGAISSVSIADVSSLKVKVNNEIKEFDVLPTVKITLGGKEASLYDLRVGDLVKITVESGAVLSISATTAVMSSNPVTGVIEVVNASKGFIKVDGETIFCKDTSTTFITAGGMTKMMKDLQEGMSVSIRGSLQNGAYIASLVIIEN